MFKKTDMILLKIVVHFSIVTTHSSLSICTTEMNDICYFRLYKKIELRFLDEKGKFILVNSASGAWQHLQKIVGQATPTIYIRNRSYWEDVNILTRLGGKDTYK